MTPDTLLGKEIEGDAVTAFLTSLAATPEIDEDDSRIFLDDPRHGLVVRAEPSTRRVTAVYLYFAGYEGYEEYAGSLPFGMRPDMTRSQVEAVMGPGRDPNGKGRKLIWDGEEHNTSVEFHKDGRMRQIVVYT